MIPLADDNPTRTKPYMTYAIIAVNIVVFLADRIGANGPVGNLWNFALVPEALWKGGSVYVPVGMSLDGHTMVALYQGLSPRWLTIFTSMFMHGNLLHIAGNMLYLWIFGNNVEDTLGHIGFLAFYLLAGFCAAFAHILTDPNSTIPMVGASGAIAGVLGAYFYLFPAAKVRTLVLFVVFWFFMDIPAAIVLGAWFLSQIFNVLGSAGRVGGGVAYAAHTGGFIAGIIMIMLMGGKKLLRKRNRPIIEDFTDWESWNNR